MGDHRTMAVLRAGLRRRLQVSPLIDGSSFAAVMETADRQAWRAWGDNCPAPTPWAAPDAVMR
ncbi:MAG: hypothetical protein VKK97_01115 [Synechococcaceae cyanobacterium]|nr:hypothetical protein [Synechococcaceae cyanobacterium]